MEDILYIKMCEKAEIQKVWKPQIGDIITDGVAPPETIQNNMFFWDEDGVKEIKDDYYWLPRQGQLQKMVSFPNSEKIGIWFEKHIAFYEWCGERVKGLQNNWGKFTSMEQLWLAFVMKKKYNKVWNGEDWIVEYEKLGP